MLALSIRPTNHYPDDRYIQYIKSRLVCQATYQAAYFVELFRQDNAQPILNCSYIISYYISMSSRKESPF